MTQQEIMLRLLAGDFDTMPKLPGRIQYRMKKAGWRYSGIACSWLKSVYPRDAYHNGTVEQGGAEWHKDVKASFAELGFL